MIRWLAGFGSLAGLWVFGLSCTPEPLGRCKQTSDCPQAKACHEGQCLILCQTRLDCLQGEVCLNDLCRRASDCPEVCTEGKRRCRSDGKGPEVCHPQDGGCLDWTPLPECTATEFCQVEQCVPCTPGFCNHKTCSPPCPSGQTCLAGVCRVDTCLHACPNEAEGRCLSETIAQRCTQTSPACLEWKSSACSSDQRCRSGHCEPPRCPQPSPCTFGERRCSADGKGVDLCDEGADGCLVWRKEEICPMNRRCKAGICALECEAATTRCFDETTVETCVIEPDGRRAWKKQACTGGLCDYGQCTSCPNPECRLGDTRCDGTRAEVCVASGACPRWYSDTCATPGETDCHNEYLQRCETIGTCKVLKKVGCSSACDRCQGDGQKYTCLDFSTTASCSLRDNGCRKFEYADCTKQSYCDAALNKCVPCPSPCTQGTLKCSGKDTMRCGILDNGCLGWKREVPCTQGERRCSAENPAQTEICEVLPEGCLGWRAGRSCPSGLICVLGGQCAKHECAIEGEARCLDSDLISWCERLPQGNLRWGRSSCAEGGGSCHSAKSVRMPYGTCIGRYDFCPDGDCHGGYGCSGQSYQNCDRAAGSCGMANFYTTCDSEQVSTEGSVCVGMQGCAWFNEDCETLPAGRWLCHSSTRQALFRCEKMPSGKFRKTIRPCFFSSSIHSFDSECSPAATPDGDASCSVPIGWLRCENNRQERREKDKWVFERECRPDEECGPFKHSSPPQEQTCFDLKYRSPSQPASTETITVCGISPVSTPHQFCQVKEEFLKPQAP